MSETRSFVQRFLDNLDGPGWSAQDAHLLVAVSGGLDSVCLLHLLRFAGRGGRRLTAAHFDHGMRDGSDADARWVAGLCRAWGVPLVTARAAETLRSEDDARRARRRFLQAASAQCGATRIATAHHADDQAETVLFRILRGTGLEGLAGIAPQSAEGLVRPLLPFWRAELERYARQVPLRWRADPTNASLLPARNRLRNRVIPSLERTVSPAARRNLVRLAELAREAEDGWAETVARLEPEVTEAGDGALLLAREPFRAYHPALGSRLVRSVLRRVGSPPGHAGTRSALQFIIDAPSGRTLQLPGGLRLEAEFDRVRVSVLSEDPVADGSPVRIEEKPGSGSGDLRLGGRRFRVAWGPRAVAPHQEDGEVVGWRAGFLSASLRFPLEVRAWRPGDRIRLAAGERRLKKLFADRRVPRSERARIPTLADASGAVHWVAGVAQSPASLPRPERDTLHLTVFHG